MVYYTLICMAKRGRERGEQGKGEKKGEEKRRKERRKEEKKEGREEDREEGKEERNWKGCRTTVFLMQAPLASKLGDLGAHSSDGSLKG